MRLQAILFDLDDTLLGNGMDAFIPRYFALLGEYAERYMPREKFLQELMICTQAMMDHGDTAVSNREAFWQAFQQRTGLDPEEMEAFFESFYRDHFPQLADVSAQQPCARELVQYCFDHGLKVVIATNPMFPRIAIEERLRWAGLPITDFPFDLVTTYENMHATKPHPAYYQEILDIIQVPAPAALMVGDDWENDIQPAAAVGLNTFWLTPVVSEPPDKTIISGAGSLAQFYDWLVGNRSPESASYRVF